MLNLMYKGKLTTALIGIDPFAQTYNRNWSMLKVRYASENAEYYHERGMFVAHGC